jgi:xanthine/CO dehydrogenase XdhC/CoxF family maturation factor
MVESLPVVSMIHCRRNATEVLESGSSTVVTYDLTNDDTWGLDLGYNGVIDVLIELVDGSWQQMADARANREACSLITAIESNDPSISVGAIVTVRTSCSEVVAEYSGSSRRNLCRGIARRSRQRGGKEADTTALSGDSVQKRRYTD